MLRAFSSYALKRLTPSQVSSYHTDGFLLLKQFLPSGFKDSLKQWATELEELPEVPGKWMKYYEHHEKLGKVLNRVENILPFHKGIRSLVDDVVTDAVSDCFGSPATVYKEKINFKFPEGNAYNAHQDQPGYVSFGLKRLVVVMVPVDDNTTLTGGLEFVTGRNQERILETNLDDGIRTDLVARYNWTPVDAYPGDMILFSSYTPHRSPVNHSEITRRNLYFVYNSLQDGDYRSAYYAKRRELFPPEIERDPTKDYTQGAQLFKRTNPFK